MISAVTGFGCSQSGQTAKFSGRSGDGDKMAAVMNASTALDVARTRLGDARQHWANVTPAQKAGLKGTAGLILLAIGSDKKLHSAVRTVILLVAAGLVGTAALDLFRIQRQKHLLSRKLDLNIDPALDPLEAIKRLKNQLADEVRQLNREITDHSPLERRVEKEMRLLEIEVAQRELELRAARIKAGLPAEEAAVEIR